MQFYTMKNLFWSLKHIRILGKDIHPDPEVIYHENFHKLLPKAHDTMKCWSNRSLTVMGKIVVINHLVNSLFIHKLMALPTPRPSFFKQFRQMVTHFLWNESPPKIAYCKLVQDYSKLGLKLLDLETQDTALKASWPVRLKERNVKEIMWLYSMLPIKDRRIWECNLNPEDQKKTCFKTPPFNRNFYFTSLV